MGGTEDCNESHGFWIHISNIWSLAGYYLINKVNTSRNMNRIKLKKMNRSYDKKLLYFTIFFTLLGVIFVLNASGPEAINKFSDRFYFAKQQLIWGITGIFIMIIVSKINYNFWKKTAIFILFISLILLL